MMEFELTDDDLYLNYKNIAECEWITPTIRLLAIDIQKNPYISVGEWFEKLSDRSVSELQELAEIVANGDDEDATQQMMLLAMILSNAEGTGDMKSIDTLRKQLSMILSIITFESLARKGFVRVYRENYTLGDDMGDRVVVERL